MGFMPLGSCCGCFSLKGGAKFIAVLCLIFCAVQIYAYTVTTVRIWPQHPTSDYQGSVAVNILLLMAVLAVVQAIVSVILLIGVTKDKPNFIVCWVVAYSSLLIVGFIFVTGLVFLVTTSFLWILCPHVVMVYFVLVVYSLYRQYVVIAFERADKEQQQHQQS